MGGGLGQIGEGEEGEEGAEGAEGAEGGGRSMILLVLIKEAKSMVIYSGKA